MRAAIHATATVALVFASMPVGAYAQGISREEAIAAVFPGATVTAERVFLTPAQQKDVLVRAGTDPTSPLIARYVASVNGQVVGRAYVDTHTVRTKKESLLIALDAQGRVKRIDVTAFEEPREFQAPEPWLRQYRDRTLGDDLGINKAIRPIAGATLTARATNAAVRRVLAIDSVLREPGGRQ
jgi:electron transport complex protein RnfG